MGGEVVAIIGGIWLLGLIGYMIWAQMRARELLHAERLAAIEKGIVPPAEPEDGNNRKPPAHALKMGIFWLFLGLGIIVSMRIADPGGNTWVWGIIVVAIGLADLVYWLVRGKAEAEAAKRDAGGK